MILVSLFVVFYWHAQNQLMINIALIMIGFLIYGPAMFIGLQALDLVPKKAAGLTGLFGYLFGSVAANALMGMIVDHFGWSVGFYFYSRFISCSYFCFNVEFTWARSASLAFTLTK